MLFLFKRKAVPAIATLVVLAGLGLGLRLALGIQAPTLDFTLANLFAGVLAAAIVLASDGLLHGMLLLLFGQAYRQRYRALAEVFRGQSVAAIFAGALLAGIGEELVFRGLGTQPAYLLTAAVLFGLLHHLRGPLAPFTLWSIWEGLLLALMLWLTGALVVSMTAHFLHDVTGFLIFRVERSVGSSAPEA